MESDRWRWCARLSRRWFWKGTGRPLHGSHGLWSAHAVQPHPLGTPSTPHHSHGTPCPRPFHPHAAWWGSRSQAPCPASGPQPAYRPTVWAGCWPRASGTALRPVPRQKAGHAPPSGRHRSPHYTQYRPADAVWAHVLRRAPARTPGFLGGEGSVRGWEEPDGPW